MKSLLRVGLVVLLPTAALGCGSSSDDGGGGGTEGDPLGITTESTWVTSRAPMSPADTRSPKDPEDRQAMLDEGYGELTAGPGEPYVTRAPAGQTAPAPGPNAKRLARFVHMPDLQLADDESPTRLAGFDSSGATAGAFRPQDSHICHMVNAAVKSVNQLHAEDPIDFLLLGGDNADSAQTNEIDWVLALLSGGSPVECDSGADDDPAPGADNDGKDPFDAPGLAVPWYWVTGNHDVLVQGNLPVNAQKEAAAVGDNAVGGTRDWSQPGGPIFNGPVVPDERRKPLVRTAIMGRIQGHGDGHGLGAEQVTSGKAIYTFDVPTTPLRFLILDTAAETGGSEGLLRQGDIDTVIQPALDAAQAEGKWVLLASHHATSSLGNGSGLGGSVQPDAVSETAWLGLLGGYSSVLFSIVGHSHQNRVRELDTGGTSPIWEVMTSALADFPHQIRIVEIWDQDNGWVMLRGTNVNFGTVGDPVAAEGRALGALDYVAGWASSDGLGTAEERNVEIWVKKP